MTHAVRRYLVCACLPAFLGCGPAPAPPSPPASAGPVEYRSRQETVRGVLYRPAGHGPFPGLVLVHGDHGLTAREKQQAERLRDRGRVVLAIDLYRGQVAADVMDAHILERGVPEDRAEADLRAAVDFLVAREDVYPDRVGVIGWGMGGGYALDAAVRDPRVRAAVVCYGRLTTDAEALAPLRASVLGVFAGEDVGIPPETVARFEAAMRKAGKRLAAHTYPDRKHGFMNAPGTETDDAWAKIESFLDDELLR